MTELPRCSHRDQDGWQCYAVPMKNGLLCPLHQDDARENARREAEADD